MDGNTAILDCPSSSAPTRSDYARRVDELGRIINSYSDITAKLQVSHEQLNGTVHRLRAELSEKNELLERSNRLAALGEMAAGMAHEIRNPLGGIQLYASLLAKDVADRQDSLELVRKISGGVRRLEAIVGQVLQFTRELHVQPAEVDLAEVIGQAVEYAGHVMEEQKIECQVKGPRPMPAHVDPLLFGQAILNLVLNAAEAVGQGGQIRVTYGLPNDASCPVSPITGGNGHAERRNDKPRSLSRRLPHGHSSSHTGERQQDHDEDRRHNQIHASGAWQFHLTITDNGPGIAPKALDRIFNPFFTTKDTGTGLGLAIVHRVIEAHGGTIVASNEPGGGARFEIRI